MKSKFGKFSHFGMAQFGQEGWRLKKTAISHFAQQWWEWMLSLCPFSDAIICVS